MRITEEKYKEAVKIVQQYLYEKNNPHDCCICGKPCRDNIYYAGDNPLCSQKCLTQWDDEHPLED